jgi:heme/copper-type cytochrome/quinol oxidase subunit 1
MDFHLLIFLTTTSHKLIGLYYGYTGYIAGFIGYSISMLIRMELNLQGLSCLRKMKEVTIYNNWITIHGLIMLFFFIMPIAIGYYGNYLLPISLGTCEFSLPRINGLSYWFLWLGGFMFMISNLLSLPISSGWTIYPPLSILDSDNLGVNIDFSLLVIHFLGISSTLGSMNSLTTNQYFKHMGLINFNLSIYNISLIITSILLLGALPLLGIAITGLLLDRNLHSNLYILFGDPVLYQHIFWFFGHPEVYVIILPIFGLASLLLTSLLHKDLFGREGMIYCLLAIGIIGFLVWAHHMFTVGLDLDSRSYFSMATSIISIPTSVKIFSYLSTWSSCKGLLGSHSTWSFFSFLLCFTLGGFTGLLLSSSALDLLLHDTYFVVGHFHTVLSLAATFGLLIAHSFFLPIFFSSSIFESLGFFHTSLLFFGAFMIFYPMHLAGLAGMARRIPEYADSLMPFVVIGFHGTLLVICSTLIFLRSSSFSFSSSLANQIS